jgi:hypothetical protein
MNYFSNSNILEGPKSKRAIGAIKNPINVITLG